MIERLVVTAADPAGVVASGHTCLVPVGHAVGGRVWLELSGSALSTRPSDHPSIITFHLSGSRRPNGMTSTLHGNGGGVGRQPPPPRPCRHAGAAPPACPTQRPPLQQPRSLSRLSVSWRSILTTVSCATKRGRAPRGRRRADLRGHWNNCPGDVLKTPRAWFMFSAWGRHQARQLHS